MSTTVRDAIGRSTGRGARGALIPEIEALRGIAVTLVFLFHASAWIGWHAHVTAGIAVSPLRAFVHGGHTGVSLFFVLSGFLLSRPFLAEAAGGTRLSRTGYYQRRALRILPLYFAAVLAASALCATRLADVLHGVPYLFFLNAVPGLSTVLRPYSNVWWSLATEVQFYLLLPLLPLFLRSPRGRWLGGVLVLTYVAAYAAFASQRLYMPTVEGRLALAHSLFGRAPLFAFGMMTAWSWTRFGEAARAWISRSRWLRGGAADAVLFLVLFGLGELLRRVAFTGYWPAEWSWHAWHVAEGFLWASVLWLLLVAPLRSKAIFCNRAWQAVGRISYSVYIVHSPLIVFSFTGVSHFFPGWYMRWDVRSVAVLGLTAVACTGISAITYRTIERPFLERKRRIAWWSSAPAAPAPG